MAPDLEALKRALRVEVTSRLAAMSEQDRSLSSARAIALLRKQEKWHGAEAVLLYAPLKGELDVWPLLGQALEEGKLVALPRFDAKAGQYVACRVKDLEADLERGRYGIWEPCGRCDPVPLKRLDFVLVPGVAFDLHGRRLGRGKGYYDRLLAGVSGKACGVAFDEQIAREVPVQPHDSDVNCILTPSRWIEL
jgi:5-formyltetrahydrofolate cyclo-ligase